MTAEVKAELAMLEKRRDDATRRLLLIHESRSVMSLTEWVKLLSVLEIRRDGLQKEIDRLQE